MFNGIIYKTAKIPKTEKTKSGLYLFLRSSLKITKKDIGSSFACNGACLTLLEHKKNVSKFYLSAETLKRTNFKYQKKNSVINLEKSLKYGQEIAGHFLTGHIDEISTIKSVKNYGQSKKFVIGANQKNLSLLIYKGSIGINGVSLTINNFTKKNFEVLIIPHTLNWTNLGALKKGDHVNIEYDLVSKHFNKLKN